jgi:drug/metabolite transporter (DMT)-like permease
MFSGLTNEICGEIQLVISVIMFGFTYVAMRQAMLTDNIGPMTFTACRFVLSVILMSVVKIVYFYFGPQKSKNVAEINVFYDTLFWGSLMGVANCAGSITLQICLVSTSAGKSGFIVGMGVVFIPFAECLIAGSFQSLTVYSWIASFISLVGLYLVSGCLEGGECFSGGLDSGEYFGFGSMFCWSTVLFLNDRGCRTVDAISLTLTSLIVAMVLSIGFALTFEFDEFVSPFSAFTSTWVLIVAATVAETTALLCTSFGQKYVKPTRAALLIAQESVSAAFFGFFFLHEVLTYIELCGCCLMLMSAMLSALIGMWGVTSDEIQLMHEEDAEYEALLLRISSSAGVEDCFDRGVSPLPSRSDSFTLSSSGEGRNTLHNGATH